MDILRVFETLRNPTEVLNPDVVGLDFEPSIMQVSLMHEEYIRTGYDKASVFVDILTKDDKWYLLIYLWELYNFKVASPYKCFYCSPGYRLNEEDEKELLHYCTAENTCTNEFMVQAIFMPAGRGAAPIPNTGSLILSPAARRKRTNCCAGCAGRS